MKKIIISRYNEDVNWVKDYPFEHIIYNKGSKLDDTFNVLDIENIGNNQRDIFSFIYENYDNLPDVMVFTQGNPFDHCNKTKFDMLINSNEFTPLESFENIIQSHAQILDTDGGYMEINNSWYIDAHNRTFNQTCAWASFDEFMNKHFINYNRCEFNRFTPGSQYIIPKNSALFYSRNFWKYLMDILYKNNMTEGHIIERSLLKIFKNYLIPIDNLI